MTGRWVGGGQRNLPNDWPKLRLIVLDRDHHACQWLDNGTRCGQPATDVDHIGHRDNHHPSNLRSLCGPHHDRRTSRQANDKRWAIRTTRPAEQHPGLL